MRTGIMGGTFDPIHIGHLYLAHEAKEVLGLDRIIFIPSGVGPHKAASETPKHIRLEMVTRAIKEYPYFDVSDMEISRSGYSYTIDSFKALKKKYPKDTFFFITGADAFLTVDSWKDYMSLVRGMHFVAAYRPIQTMDESTTMENLQILIEQLEAKGAKSISALPILGLDISSSDLRKRIATGRHVNFLIPPSIISLIEEHKLYGWKSK